MGVQRVVQVRPILQRLDGRLSFPVRLPIFQQPRRVPGDNRERNRHLRAIRHRRALNLPHEVHVGHRQDPARCALVQKRRGPFSEILRYSTKERIWDLTKSQLPKKLA